MMPIWYGSRPEHGGKGMSRRCLPMVPSSQTNLGPRAIAEFFHLVVFGAQLGLARHRLLVRLGRRFPPDEFVLRKAL